MGLSENEHEYFLTLQLNARLQPMHRGDIYENPIGEALEAIDCGTTTGGGTMMHKNGGIQFCDVEITLNDHKKETLDILLRIIAEIRVPKGSFLRAENLELPVGTLEGLALYINGTELSEEIYQSCDINVVVETINELLAPSGSMYSYWEGSEDTALYFYGNSFNEMKEKMEAFLLSYPLCQKCKIEKIA